MFNQKYEAWASQQVQEPPKYVYEAMKIFTEHNKFLLDSDAFSYLYWDHDAGVLASKKKISPLAMEIADRIFNTEVKK